MNQSIETLRQELLGLQKKYKEIERANQTLNEQLLELYSLYNISLILSSMLDFEETIHAFRKIFQKNFDLDQFSLMLLDPATQRLELRTSFGLPKAKGGTISYALGENIFGVVALKGRRIYVPDVEKDKRFKFHPGKKRRGSFLCLPLKPEEGRLLGILGFHRDKPNAFARREIDLFNRIANLVALTIQKTLLYQQLRELSITDELTGIYNRRYFNQRFEEELRRAERYKHPLSILMIDIDFFKHYNDIHGHIMGDEVLKKISHLILTNIRKADILARYGGEEFVVLLPEIDKERAKKVAEKLRKKIEKSPFDGEEQIPGNRLTISLGISAFPVDAETAEELLEIADKSLYMAKANGRNRVGYQVMRVKDVTLGKVRDAEIAFVEHTP